MIDNFFQIRDNSNVFTFKCKWLLRKSHAYKSEKKIYLVKPFYIPEVNSELNEDLKEFLKNFNPYFYIYLLK